MKNKPYFGVYLFYWMANAVLLPYIGIIYKQKGLTGSQIGAMSVLEAVIIPVAGGDFRTSKKDKMVYCPPSIVMYAFSNWAIFKRRDFCINLLCWMPIFLSDPHQ